MGGRIRSLNYDMNNERNEHNGIKLLRKIEGQFGKASAPIDCLI